jgi:hypothetical protein
MDFLGGSTDVSTYGELPGRQSTGQQLSTALQGWLKGLGGTTAPGLGEAGQLWSSSQPVAGAGNTQLSKMLSGDWLKETPADWGELEGIERAQMEKNLGTTLGGLKMDYGSKGQTFSSPMIRALADAELGTRQNLEAGQINRRTELYQQKMGMLPQLIQMAKDDPYRAAALLQAGGGQLIQQLLQYLQASKGETVVQQNKGLLDYAVPIAAGGLSGGSLSF